MKIKLIKRNKIIHAGIPAKVFGEVNIYSVCNQRWDADDEVSIGTENEVTCKRCQKKLAKADSQGRIILK